MKNKSGKTYKPQTKGMIGGKSWKKTTEYTIPIEKKGKKTI